MNEYFIAFLLGIVEGLTEFLPVSSTAHLRIVQHFLGISLDDEYWKLFAIFIQLGAILSVVTLYRVRLVSLCKSFFRKPTMNHPFVLVSIAFKATVIPAFLLTKVIGDNLEKMSIIIASLIIGGLVMIVVDHYFAARGKVTSIEKMKPWQAFFIGVVQILAAVFPGTSRSMSTIAGGQLAGLSRATALEFSFFVSVPIMFAATLYDLFRYLRDGGVGLTLDQSGILAVGFVTSFFVGYASIAWLLSFVRTQGFFWFGIYRITFGMALYLVL